VGAEGLVEGEGWGWGGDATPHRGKGLGRGQKKGIFLLIWRVLVNYERYFVRTLARKMSNFPPEVVIWLTLKMYILEVVNALSELWGW